ncbi:MAG: hypothetical protein C0483_02475 [Pirellula sp.]|nr:hypothetical protein [Pirellula sp.]
MQSRDRRIVIPASKSIRSHRHLPKERVVDDIPLAPVTPAVRKNQPGPLPPGRVPPTAHHAVAPGFQEPPRRGFFMQALAVLLGGLVGLVPLAAGLAVYLDPLRRIRGKAEPVPVTTLDALPDASKHDALVGLYKIMANRQDAWNLYPNEPVGAVYLVVPKGTKEIKALNATCPHLGCFVDVQQGSDGYSFKCPCHTSAFTGDGSRIMPCVSPRNMDEMKCTVTKVDGRLDVSVVFENFQPGLEEKKPKT